MLRRIVAGIDGGQAGEDAAVLAETLADVEAVELLLVGVWPEVPLPVPVVLGAEAKPLEQVEQMLLGVRERLAPRGVTKVLSDRSIARALRRLGDEREVDLFVLGSAAKATRGHARAGRDARQVVQEAPCAVAVAARGLQRAPFALRRVVVGVDGGAESEAALRWALALAGSHGAQVTAVAVADDSLPPVTASLTGGTAVVQWQELTAYRRERAEQVTAAAIERDGVVAAQVRIGDPAAELAAAAADADLLVVGSRQWGPLARVVLGSVGHDLLRDAPCSLVLVPRPADGEAPS